MMLLHSLLDRRLCGSAREPHSYPLESLLLHYKCIRQDEHTSGGDLGEPVPPFGCLWSTANGFHRVLAVVNEEGVVKLYNTESHNREDPTFREWLAHNNAVFDIAWVPGEPKLVTASGDQTARLWDVNVSELLGTFKGHQCSLKSVSFGKWEKAVFCTGGRDGNIMVWDTRCNKKGSFYRPVKQITGAHNTLAKQTPPKQKKKRQTVRGLAPSVDFQQSVTVVLFQDENTLISAGAVDGVIKVWDLRKNYSVHHQEPMPVWFFSYPGNSTRRLGYSNLILDSTGSNLFANCTDDNIYMFNLTGLQSAPVATFSGHQNSTFYVKSSLSPDGHFLLSGSSDHNAYIWKVCDSHQPPTVLQGHSQEVTSVTWCPSDFTKIATCSDDNTVRIWRLNRGMKGLTVGSQSSDLVGYASRKKQLEREAVEGPSHITPPRALKMQTPSPSSCQQAACATDIGGDLPLPSNIPAPVFPAPGPSVGNCLAPQATTSSQPTFAKMLIKTWVIQSPRLCTSRIGTQSPSTTRMVLGPVGHSLVRGGTDDVASDKKVKRRLDTGGDLAVGHDCSPDQGYSCIEEAGPVFKRTKLDTQSHGGTSPCSKCEEEMGLRHSPPHGNEDCFPFAQLSPSAGLEILSSAGKFQCKGSPDSPDKENSSPHKTNWLTAMGEKQRVDMGTRARRFFSSPTAPASQSPTVRRREERSAGFSPSQMRKISSYFQRKLTNDRSV